MVLHEVATDHTFSVPCGAAIVVHEADAGVEIVLQYGRGEPIVHLSATELLKLAEAFTELQIKGGRLGEIVELVTEAADVFRQ